MRQVCWLACVLAALVAAASCRPAATPAAQPAPTALVPVVGTALPGESGALPVPPPLVTATVVEVTPAPTVELIPTGSSGIHLTATIGPTCPGPERPGQVCTQPYQGQFVVTGGNGAEVARVTTDENGQALIDLPPGEYTVTPQIEGRFPSGAPVSATVGAGQYVEVNVELDSGIR